MKTAVTLFVIFTILISSLVYVVYIQNNNRDTRVDEQEESLVITPTLTFDQATVYTCADGSTVATAFKTNDPSVVEISLPNLGPVVMTKDESVSEAKFSSVTGYMFLDTAGTLVVEKDGETLYKDCQEGLPATVVASVLVNTQWQWVETTYATGTPSAPNNPDDFSITFAPDNRFSATTDCNNIGGGYTESPNGEIVFTDIISTSMACEGDINEGIFISQLEQVVAYQVTGNELRLQTVRDEGGGDMKFTKLP